MVLQKSVGEREGRPITSAKNEHQYATGANTRTDGVTDFDAVLVRMSSSLSIYSSSQDDCAQL